MTVVLDAWALLALLKDEPPAERVEEVVERGDALMSVINLGEAYYKLIQDIGQGIAGDSMLLIRQRVRIEPADWRVTSLACEFKARAKLSYADAFCVATAQRHKAPLWTGDPEIIALADEVEIVDLR